MAVRREPGFLPEPYEIWEIGDGESMEIEVLRYEVGKMIIHPKWPGAPAEKEIRVVRVYVAREKKPYGPDYWDITPTTLIYDLLPKLEAWRLWPAKLKITAAGKAPRKRFTVDVGRKE